MSRSDLFLLLALGLVFTPIEWLWPIRRTAADWQRLRTDFLHIFISGALIRLAISLVIAGLGLVSGHLLPSAVGETIRGQPAWLQYIEIVLLADFAFYGFHRLSHASPTLWRFHQVHHSSEKLDWIAGNRVHPVDQVLLAATYTAAPLLLGFSPGPLLAYALIFRWHAELLHSNVRIDFGPLKWLVASPQYHHWHHADEPAAYDRNFGGQLLVFDWLFGTLNLPREGMPQKYGLSEPIPRDYVGQMIHPFRRPRRDAQPAPETSAA
jgi:sterol desaturase/sphingolipid hydroxylase (fatty acid hydroxylase superfamily)